MLIVIIRLYGCAQYTQSIFLHIRKRTNKKKTRKYMSAQIEAPIGELYRHRVKTTQIECEWFLFRRFGLISHKIKCNTIHTSSSIVCCYLFSLTMFCLREQSATKSIFFHITLYLFLSSNYRLFHLFTLIVICSFIFSFFPIYFKLVKRRMVFILSNLKRPIRIY